MIKMLGGYKKGEHFIRKRTSDRIFLYEEEQTGPNNKDRRELHVLHDFIGVDQFHHSKQKDIEMKEEKVYVFMM